MLCKMFSVTVIYLALSLCILPCPFDCHTEYLCAYCKLHVFSICPLPYIMIYIMMVPNSVNTKSRCKRLSSIWEEIWILTTIIILQKPLVSRYLDSTYACRRITQYTSKLSSSRNEEWLCNIEIRWSDQSIEAMEVDRV